MRRALSLAGLLLAVSFPAGAAGDHEVLAAQQELKIAKDHLQDAGMDYGGHRRAAMQHIDRALQEIRQAIDYSRGRESGGPPTTKSAPKGTADQPDDD